MQKYESNPDIIDEMIVEVLLLRFMKIVAYKPKQLYKLKDELYLNLQADYDAKILGKFLAKNTSINKIYLGGSSIGHNFEDFQHLCAGLAKNKGLTEFYLTDNCLPLKNEYAQCLANALAENRTLKVLDLSQNFIGDYAGSLEILCSQGLLKNKSLDWVNMGIMNLGKQPDELKFLAEVIEKQPTLRILNLGRNPQLFVQESNAKAFGEGVKNAKNLEQLTLNACELGKRNSDFKILKEAVLKNKSLKLLNLNANFIGGDFWEPKPFVPLLAEIISETNTLKKIRFSENNIHDTPENKQVLTEAIKATKSIISVECLQNKLWFNKQFQDFVGEFNDQHFSEANNFK